jgi:hypothetical protein
LIGARKCTESTLDYPESTGFSLENVPLFATRHLPAAMIGAVARRQLELNTIGNAIAAQ